MSKTTIFITGANLHIGKQLIQMIPREKFKIVAGIDVNVDTRDIKDYCDEIMELDYDSSDSVNKVFEQPIDVLFLLPSKSEERALQAKRLIASGLEHVKHIILVSLLDCHSRTGILAAQFRYIEQYIEATGIPFTILRSAPLQQNFFDLVKDFQTKLATVSIPIGVGQYAPIHCTDIARVASNIIQDPKKHFGKTYRLTGPELVTGVQIAGKASMGLYRPVRFVNKVSSNLHNGLNTWARILDIELYQLIAKGFFTAVSPDVEQLTGKKGITLEEFFSESASVFNQGYSGLESKL